MKRILSLLLALAVLLALPVCSFAAIDEEFRNDRYTYEYLSDTEAAVASFFGQTPRLHMGSCIGHRWLTAIGDGAFEHVDTLVYLKVSSYVRTIGNYAFHGCSLLHQVDLPPAVSSIGSYAFQSCTNLRRIILPEGITSLEEGTFMFCLSLKDVTLPSTLEKIGPDAFVFCLALEDLAIPASVTEIAPDAFRDCPNLTLTVADGSYAQEYAENNGIPYVVA